MLHYAKDSGNRSWKVQFLPTGIYGITSGGGPLLTGRNIPTEIRRSIFDRPVLCPN